MKLDYFPPGGAEIVIREPRTEGVGKRPSARLINWREAEAAPQCFGVRPLSRFIVIMSRFRPRIVDKLLSDDRSRNGAAEPAQREHWRSHRRARRTTWRASTWAENDENGAFFLR